MTSPNVIGTGSSGNAVQIGKSILVDCGVSCKLLQPVKADLSLVLLTHQHGDHFNPRAVRKLAADRPGLRWAMCDWMLPLAQGNINPRQIDVLVPGVVYGYGKITVCPVLLTHDVPNCGYRITLESGERIFYATDTGTLDGIKAEGYDLYMIESNHDREELERRAKEKMERGEFSYEYRAAQNHLSRQQADDWLSANVGPFSKVMYLHQHKEE